ncbi:MAG: long-chain fatty acid--CoA ligase [Bacteroidetes bacterium]|nr:long-chain fatty acid--CoA ligase [Bacteroidota bacterium]
MDYNHRLFDFLYRQQNEFPKDDMFAAKESGEWKKYSTNDVADIVNRLSAGLLSLGLSGNDMEVTNQDKVALISPNRPEWLLLDLACQQIGVILCPVYPTSNIQELEFIFKDAEIKFLFTGSNELYEKMQPTLKTVPSLKNIYSFDQIQNVPYWKDLLVEPNNAILESERKKIKPDNCATIIYTSGTTGTPKGVMLSHKNIVSNVINSVVSFPFERNIKGRALSFLPLNHIFERLASYIFMYSGISIYFAESLEKIGDNLKEVKPNVFCTVPRLLEKIYEKIMAKGSELTGIKKQLFFWSVNLAKKYDNNIDGGWLYNLKLSIANKLVFSKWREATGGNIEYIITGSAACQVRLLRIFNAAKIPIYEGYGPTENSPVISVNRQTPGGMKFGTVGPVLEGQEVKIESDGEICVKGPSVMLGYYKRSDLTEETVIDGWLHTGDIGVFEDGKFLKITDRKKELFKTSGGKYVAPQPIENKMRESRFIEQIMVVGEDKKFVAALIVPSVNNIQEWLKDNNILPAGDVLKMPEVLNLFRTTIDDLNKNFNHVEQIKKFELLPHEWTIENGELTPTLKLKRKVILEKYNNEIKRIYNIPEGE